MLAEGEVRVLMVGGEEDAEGAKGWGGQWEGGGEAGAEEERGGLVRAVGHGAEGELGVADSTQRRRKSIHSRNSTSGLVSRCRQSESNSQARTPRTRTF